MRPRSRELKANRLKLARALFELQKAQQHGTPRANLIGFYGDIAHYAQLLVDLTLTKSEATELGDWKRTRGARLDDLARRLTTTDPDELTALQTRRVARLTGAPVPELPADMPAVADGQPYTLAEHLDRFYPVQVGAAVARDLPYLRYVNPELGELGHGYGDKGSAYQEAQRLADLSGGFVQPMPRGGKEWPKPEPVSSNSTDVPGDAPELIEPGQVDEPTPTPSEALDGVDWVGGPSGEPTEIPTGKGTWECERCGEMLDRAGQPHILIGSLQCPSRARHHHDKAAEAESSPPPARLRDGGERSGRFALVGCSKTKAAERCAARDLYTSRNFRAAVADVEARYAHLDTPPDEQTVHGWAVLSARHGVLRPGDVAGPYDLALSNLSKQRRTRWAHRVALTLEGMIPPGLTVELHAGGDYVKLIAPKLIELGHPVVVVGQGLAVGERFAHYKARAAEQGRELGPHVPTCGAQLGSGNAVRCEIPGEHPGAKHRCGAMHWGGE